LRADGEQEDDAFEPLGRAGQVLILLAATLAVVILLGVGLAG
jgi:hypothetical protein